MIELILLVFSLLTQDKYQECSHPKIKRVLCCESELKILADGDIITVSKKQILCKACASKAFDEHVIKELTSQNRCDCPKCSDAAKQIKKGVAKTATAKACERSYWSNPDCEKCRDQKRLREGKCCNGKGEQMREFTDVALLIDVCETCGRMALPNRKIDHDASIHEVWICPECKEEFKQKRTHCSKAKDPAGTMWNPPYETVLSKKPEKILKGVCIKSGSSRIQKSNFEEINYEENVVNCCTGSVVRGGRS